MVFKRVLKGIGRLMLTTAVMCGVGLFLCSSEVKADVSVKLESDGSDGFKVTVTAADTDITAIMTNKIKIQLLNGTNVLYEEEVEKNSLNAGSDNEIKIDATKFIGGSVKYKDSWDKVLTSTPGTITINKVELYDLNGGIINANLTQNSPTTKKIYKVGKLNKKLVF